MSVQPDERRITGDVHGETNRLSVDRKRASVAVSRLIRVLHNRRGVAGKEELIVVLGTQMVSGSH